MKVLRHRGLILVAALTLLCGCVPMRAYDNPTVRVSIVNAETGMPIAGASITNLNSGDRKPVSVVTDREGEGLLPPVSHWTVIPINLDPALATNTIEISAPGYRPKQVEIQFVPVKGTPIVSTGVSLTPASGGTGTGPTTKVHPISSR